MKRSSLVCAGAAGLPPVRRCANPILLVAGLVAFLPGSGGAEPLALAEPRPLTADDVFQLELASDPQISPDGRWVVYCRVYMDVMKDRRRSSLWLVSTESGEHRALTDGLTNASSPRWSPLGDRLVYTSNEGESTQIWQRWMDSGQTARLTQLARAPSSLEISPDGRWIAFSMLVPAPSPPMVPPPARPEGAEWAPAPRVIEKLLYRADGAGYLEDGYRQVFVLPTEGGTPRQITDGPYNHGGALSWTPDSQSILLSAHRNEGWEYEPLESEVYEISLSDGAFRALTDRSGPDRSPVASPDGRRVAFVGFDDRLQGYQVANLYVMDRDGGGRRQLASGLDRDVESPTWTADSRSLVFQYDDRGTTRVARVDLDERVDLDALDQLNPLIDDLGGTSLDRPYSGGSFSIARDGRLAYTRSRPDRPADVAVRTANGEIRQLTNLNEDALGYKDLGPVEELWWESSFDGRRVQGWLILPPGFDPEQRYPLLLEIHGGPFANYGPSFAAELQLYAAAGYVVLYTNPRGSTGYGEEFGNLIHHAYPGNDYDDLMSAVDAVLARGFVDPERLFVTGGSGGGVLTAWIVGKTDRFRAAVVAKPVINWYSFVLTSDGYNTYSKYWFPGPPWEHAEHYLARSPLSLVGNVRTPTMMLTGESDLRTPMAESEQYYQALKLRRVPTALVRVPDASHGIAERPSHLIAKVQHTLAWFARYDAANGGSANRGSANEGH